MRQCINTNKHSDFYYSFNKKQFMSHSWYRKWEVEHLRDFCPMLSRIQWIKAFSHLKSGKYLPINSDFPEAHQFRLIFFTHFKANVVFFWGILLDRRFRDSLWLNFIWTCFEILRFHNWNIHFIVMADFDYKEFYHQNGQQRRNRRLKIFMILKMN